MGRETDAFGFSLVSSIFPIWDGRIRLGSSPLKNLDPARNNSLCSAEVPLDKTAQESVRGTCTLGNLHMTNMDPLPFVHPRDFASLLSN